MTAKETERKLDNLYRQANMSESNDTWFSLVSEINKLEDETAIENGKPWAVHLNSSPDHPKHEDVKPN